MPETDVLQRTNRPRRRVRVAAAAAALTALLGAACSAGGDQAAGGVPSLGRDTTTTTTKSGDTNAGLLAFERCMRDNGVDVGGGQVRTRGEGGGEDPRNDPDYRRAFDACRHLMGNVAISDGSPPLDPGAQDAMVAYARCMRAGGVDMPDPADGGLVGQAGSDQGFDPESKEYRAADEKCRHHLAALNVDSSGGEQR